MPQVRAPSGEWLGRLRGYAERSGAKLREMETGGPPILSSIFDAVVAFGLPGDTEEALISNALGVAVKPTKLAEDIFTTAKGRVFRKGSAFAHLDDAEALKRLRKARKVWDVGGPEDPTKKAEFLKMALGWPSAEGHRYVAARKMYNAGEMPKEDYDRVVKEVAAGNLWAQLLLERVEK